MLKRMVKFLRWLEENDNYIIVSHSDADGAISAYIISKILDSLGKKYDVTFSSISRKRRVFSEISSENIIILDLSIDDVLDLLSGKNFWVIDHHKPLFIENGINLFQEIGGVGSASTICFYIANIFEGVKNVEIVDGRVGVLSAISDGNLIDCLPVLKITMPSYELENYIGRGILFGIFSIYSTLFDWMGTDPLKAKEFYESLKRNDQGDSLEMLVKTLEDLGFENAIEQNVKILKKGLKYLEKRRFIKIFETENVVIYKIKKRDAYFSRFIVDFLRNAMPEKEVVGVYFEWKDRGSISLRSLRVDLLERLKDINARVGGHKKAVSISFERERLKEILREISERI